MSMTVLGVIQFYQDSNSIKLCHVSLKYCFDIRYNFDLTVTDYHHYCDTVESSIKLGNDKAVVRQKICQHVLPSTKIFFSIFSYRYINLRCFSTYRHRKKLLRKRNMANILPPNINFFLIINGLCHRRILLFLLLFIILYLVFQCQTQLQAIYISYWK